MKHVTTSEDRYLAGLKEDKTLHERLILYQKVDHALEDTHAHALQLQL